jgi:N utilization substance protein B
MALQVLYQMDTMGAGAGPALRLFQGHLAESNEGEAFAEALVEGFDAEREKIDEIIRGVSHHWRLERMARVDRNILRLGTYELLRMADIPRRVTLNEAVELAKRFGSEGSAGFVNGVLDRIATDLGKE